MSINPPAQYATDTNFRARQRLWADRQPPFDIVAWVLDAAGLAAGSSARILDVGCGNGWYLTGLRARGVDAVGCDLSLGMLAAAAANGLRLTNGDVTGLPFVSSAFDVVLAPHMLYHVADRKTAVSEIRRVLRPGGRFVAVTNGGGHTRAVNALVESAVRQATPGWEMRNPSTHQFSLENGEEQLREAFGDVRCVRPSELAPVRITDASIVADYVASVADHYQPETVRPWHDVVEDVRAAVQREIDAAGAFFVHGDVGAFICG